MKIIRFIKRIFRKHSSKYEIWDTSALSNHFELFKSELQSKNNVLLVVPEGVSHEISVGRRTNDHCKEIYRLIEGNVRNPKLIIEVANDATRSWSIDEQVIYVANKYDNMGYDTTMITCDRDQSLRAKLKKLKVKLLSAAKAKEERKETPTLSANNANKIPVVVPIEDVPAKQFPTCTNEVKEEIELPARMVGKQCWLAFDKAVSVYDTRGKRKIPRSDGTVVTCGDTIQYNNIKYIVKTIGNNVVKARISEAR